ncbi:serine/threonine protein kinase, partial [Schlesneria paludicola]|uniref:serine/threonine protein kinase n=1 Tax=Schlesneria paludicola TaxID=360056 RepID=UPI000299E0E7
MAEEEPLIIDEQYQFVMNVASGSSSMVWEVVEKTSGRHLAMKVLKKEVPEFKENKSKMKREGEILKSLEHPMIVKFEKFSSNRDYTYILMEYFRAANLKIQIKADLNKIHLKARPLMEGVCSALSHVHQKGYIHRDIKPDNVLMNRAGEIRLCDFSLSSKEVKGFGALFAGKMKTIQGTRTYIAPETIRRRQPTQKTDLYSLGILFFELLTGRTPFQAPSPELLLEKHLKTEPPNPSEFNPNVSPEMDRIVARLLKKKPADRPANVDEVLAELRRIRLFKEDIVDAEAHKKANEDNDAIAMLSEIRLDSRADAKLKVMIETNPEFARKFEIEKQEKAAKKKREMDLLKGRIQHAEGVEATRKANSPNAPAAAPPASAPAQPVYAPQPMPMPMPMQGYPPGYPAFPPGYAPYPQGGMPPGMMPGMPQYPPQPGMGYPQGMPQMPIQPAPPQPRPAAPPAGAAPP